MSQHLIRPVKDRDNNGSEDWKYLAQQLANVCRRTLWTKDQNGNVVKATNDELTAAIEAVLRAGNHGMGA